MSGDRSGRQWKEAVSWREACVAQTKSSKISKRSILERVRRGLLGFDELKRGDNRLATGASGSFLVKTPKLENALSEQPGYRESGTMDVGIFGGFREPGWR